MLLMMRANDGILLITKKILTFFFFFFSQGWTWPKMGSVFLAAVFIALQFAIAKANPESKRLYDDLLSNYNRLIRPVGE